ncbi:U3 snoRNP protein [Cavenderia fasciculata]|uniref:HEAT repeat-containing protein 1 n=1 Tax=Cavenderia fasciculata TaxID=261658 RepID=F4PUG1_CACFS|nr:U3 snoRNP protein [Cavenderia fasciculata]EGG21033.1 U3 snoRNP protein [Cavenderia fasciculata]|eukprot:XP_004358883.1 U3 snoRNP protein [Cavenderia fasciculata]
MDQDQHLQKLQEKRKNRETNGRKGAKFGPKKRSELDRQLEVIKYNARVIGNLNKRETVLFGDANTAGTVDYDSILDLGKEGLRELTKLDSRFKSFEKNLFANSSRDENRMMMTKDQTKVLDESIDSFLRLLSAYYLLMPAQQCLEWLIRRYRINEFNLDQLLMCTLPYHQSNAFAQLLSILRYESDKKWRFLIVFRHNKVTITRDYLVGLLHKNAFFLDLVCSTILKYEKTNTLNKTMISFFTALMVDAVSVGTLTDQFIRTVLPCLNFSLKSKNLDLQLGSFMILSNIASKVQFSKDVLELLIRNTLLNHSTSITASFTFLLVLFQRQNFKSLSNSNLELLVSIPALKEIMLDLHSQNKSLDRMITLMVVYLCDSFDINENSRSLLELFVKDLPTSEKIHQIIVSRLLNRYINNFQKIDLQDNQNENETTEEKKQSSTDSSSASVDSMEIDVEEKESKMSEIIHFIEPRLVQEIINSTLSTNMSNQQQDKQNLVLSFQEKVFAQRVVSSSSATTLYLKLQSPVIENRLSGLAILKEQIEKGASDVTSFANVLGDRLSDEDDNVTLAAWGLPNLVQLFGGNGSTLVNAAGECFAMGSLSTSTKVFVLDTLIKIQSTHPFGQDTSNRLCQILLENLVFGNKKDQDEIKLRTTILKSFNDIKECSPYFRISSTPTSPITSNLLLVKSLSANITKQSSNQDNIQLFKSIFIQSSENYLSNDKLIILLSISNSIFNLKSKEEKIEFTNIIIEFLKIYLKECLEDCNTDGIIENDITLEQICNEMTLYEEEQQDNDYYVHALFYCIDVVINSFTPIESSELFIKELQNLNAGMSFTSATTKSNNVTNHLIHILISLFNLLFESMTTLTQHSDNLESFLQQIIKRYLPNHIVLLKFLSIFWSDKLFNSTIQETALSLCNCFLESKSFKKYSMNQSILCLFLLPLVSSHRNVREAAGQCIKSIEKSVNNAANNTPQQTSVVTLFEEEKSLLLMSGKLYGNLLGTLVDYMNELVMDNTFMCTLVPSIIMSTDNSELTKEQSDSVCSYLITVPLLYENNANRSALWSALSTINDPIFLSTLSTYTHSLLKLYEQENLTSEQSSILNVLLLQLVQDYSLESKKNNHLALLYKVLSYSNGITLVGATDNQKYRILDIVLPRLTSTLLNALPTKEQTKIVEAVLDLLHSSTDIECRQLAAESLHSIMIDSTCILTILSNIQVSQTSIPRITAIMETIKENASSIKKIAVLLKPTLSILKQLNQVKSIGAASTEYCKQVLITTILSISESFFKSDIELFSELFDISIILKCVESSGDLQTRNCALALLSRVAHHAPKHLFEEFGNILEMIKSALVKQDAPTFRILCGFLGGVVPSIVNNKDLSSSSKININSIFGLFLEHFKQISNDYCVPLFLTMIQSIDYQKLDLLFVQMLVKRINLLRTINEVESKPKTAADLEKEKQMEKEQLGDYIQQANPTSSQQQQLESFNKFIEQLCDCIPAAKISRALSVLAKISSLISLEKAEFIEDNNDLGFNDKEVISLLHSKKDNRLLQTMILEFIEERLSSNSYLENLTFKSNKQEKEQIEQCYLKSFANLLILLRQTTEFSERIKSTTDQSSKGKEKFLKKILASIHKCMDKLNQLMSVDGFVDTVSELLNHADPQVRRRSLVIFNDKITALKSQLSAEQIVRFLSLLDSFSKVIESSQETDTNKQTALLSFEILARNFAQTHSATFLQQMPIIIRAIGHANHQVVSSSLICVATLCAELQAKIVPYIPQFFPVLLSTLTGSYASSVDSETRALLQLSCVSSIEMMLKKISKFLSPYLPKLLNALLHPRLTLGASSKLMSQVRRVLSLITRNIEFRLLLPAMTSAYEFAVVSENDSSIICLFDFVGEISANLSPKDVGLHHRSIFKFYLQGFEFRRRYQAKVSNIDLIEEHIISSFMTLVLKLNENLFKPIFLKTIEWGIGQLQQQQNQQQTTKKTTNQQSTKQKESSDSAAVDLDNVIFFYKLMNSLVTNLKTIFVPYMAYFLDNSVYHLTELIVTTPTSTAVDAQSGSKRKKGSGLVANKSSAQESTQEKLLCLVTSTLQKCMFYDRDRFIDKQRFEVLMPALVGQLENQMGSNGGNAPLTADQLDTFAKRIENYLAPCITQLAVTINQDLLWKPLNHAVLLKTRSPFANVRYGALQVLDTLHKRMGDRLLVFLPETIPFISELLDDSVPQVEKMTQRFIKTIETHLGSEESISSYL